MTNGCPCGDAEFLSSVRGIQALPVLLRLLVRGEPVDLDAFVDLTGDAGVELARVVRGQPGSEWDGTGRLLGFGLTPKPTAYKFLVDGRTLYTWCASDTLFFTIILGQDSAVESTCPRTGQRIRLEVTPDGITSITPPGAVVSQRHRDDLIGDLRADVCDHGHFFASPASASDWLDAHPDGQVLSVTDAFSAARTASDELGWLSREGHDR
jgi:alkylmercury lyase